VLPSNECVDERESSSTCAYEIFREEVVCNLLILDQIKSDQ
jgi:hypothetical protein